VAFAGEELLTGVPHNIQKNKLARSHVVTVVGCLFVVSHLAGESNMTITAEGVGLAEMSLRI